MNTVINALMERRFFKRTAILLNQQIGNLMQKVYSCRIKAQYHGDVEVAHNKIVFMTYNDTYMCNPKYIAEEILRQGLPWDLVWLVPAKGSMPAPYFPSKIRQVRRKTFGAYLEKVSARVWIDNSLNFQWEPTPKKKGQIYMETWHGSMGIKRVGKDDVQNKRWVETARRVGRLTDFCISNSDFEDGVFRETFWPNAEILRYGHARNDCLFHEDEILAARRKVSEAFALEPSDKILLYAPTFRESKRLDVYDIDFERLALSLGRAFGGTWKILFRLHFHNRKSHMADLPDCVLPATSYPDMQELMMASDAGITDYSSWAYDYILLRRPLFIYAADRDEYDHERGLYFTLESTPFPIAENNEELNKNVLRFQDDLYQTEIDRFLKEKGCVEDGHAAQRIVEKLKEYLSE